MKLNKYYSANRTEMIEAFIIGFVVSVLINTFRHKRKVDKPVQKADRSEQNWTR